MPSRFSLQFSPFWIDTVRDRLGLEISLSKISKLVPLSGPHDDRLRELTSESKALFREVVEISAMPRVVDLTKLRPGGKWVPQSEKPEVQWEIRKEQIRMLGLKVEQIGRKLPAIRGVVTL